MRGRSQFSRPLFDEVRPGREGSLFREVNFYDGHQSSPEDFQRYRRAGTNLCTDSADMLVLGRNWKTCFTLAGQRARTISHQVEQSLWQHVGTIEKLHQSNETLQTKLFLGDKIQVCKTWIISGRFFCRRFVRFQNNFRRSVLCFWTTSSKQPISQQCRIRHTQPPPWFAFRFGSNFQCWSLVLVHQVLANAAARCGFNRGRCRTDGQELHSFQSIATTCKGLEGTARPQGPSRSLLHVSQAREAPRDQSETQCEMRWCKRWKWF